MTTVTPVEKAPWPTADGCNAANCELDQAYGAVMVLTALAESADRETVTSDAPASALYFSQTSSRPRCRSTATQAKGCAVMSADDMIPIDGGQNPVPSVSPPAKPPREKRRANLNCAQIAGRIERERSKLFGVLGIEDTVKEALCQLECARPNYLVKNP